MQFNTIFVVFSALLAGGMASPITDAAPVENSLDVRGSSGCTQSNQCSTGVPYCCSPNSSGGNNCVQSDVSCNQQVICCNNNVGMQLCIGGIDFNMPITFNINITA
ncbi:hypothetical protein V8E54_003344 [Elaphomyces granulatus]